MNKGSSQSPNVMAAAISRQMVQVNAVHLNVAQEYIMITEDKTYRCMVDWKSKLEQRDQWIAPMSLFASLTLTFVTSTFKDAFGIPKESWQAVFVIGIAVSAKWWCARCYYFSLWKQSRSG